MRPPRPLLWAFLIAGGAALVPAAFLAAGYTLVWRDTARLFGPMRGLVVEALRAFRLPLWNPHEGLGIPLFAQMMHGVLHPMSVVGAFLAPGAGMDVFIVAYVVLAALGAAVAARTMGVSRAAAAAAGFGYALSGYVLGMSAVMQYLGAGATAPWVVAALCAAAQRRRYGMPLAALAVAAMHLAGDPQWTIAATSIGGALAFALGGARGLGSAALAAALGSAVAAVQLFPAWAHLGEAARAGGLSPEERAQWALAPWRIVELVAPGFFSGRPGVTVVAPVFRWLGGSTQQGQNMPFVPSVFIGGPVLVLAAAGVPGSRATKALAACAGVCLWLALGQNAGAEQALHAVPVWGAFRYAEKMLGPLTLCLALLAGAGIDRLASGPPPRWLAVTGACALVAAVAAVVCLASPASGLTGAEAPVELARRHLAIGMTHAAVGLGALWALLIARARAPRLHGQFALAAAVLVLFLSSAASPFALHAGERGAREDAPLRAITSQGGLTRIATLFEGAPYPHAAGVDDWDRATAVESRMGVAPYNVPARIDQLNTYSGLSPRRLHEVGAAFAQGMGPRLWIGLRRYGLNHVVVKDPTSADEVADASAAVEGARLAFADPQLGYAVWEVPHRPWASFADRVVAVGPGEDALAVVVEAERRGDPAVAVEGPAPETLAPGRIVSAYRGVEAIRIEATSEDDGLLVVNDAYWPGWSATIDGEPVPILRADYLVRAVSWPAGHHVVEMRYEPAEVRVGAIVSAIGLFAVVMATVRPALRRRTAT